MNRAYDVTLDGKGYMLAKGVGGSVQSGGLQLRMSDPFSRYVSEQGKYAVQEMRFDAGAGIEQFDGTHRYTHGTNIDTRSGSLRVGPEWQVYGENADGAAGVASTTTPGTVEIAAGKRYAGNFNFGAVRTVRRVGVLLSRKANVDYTGAGDVTIQICDTSNGDPPQAVLASKTVSIEQADLWRQDSPAIGDKLAWVEVILSADVTKQYIWIVVNNTASEPVLWAVTAEATRGTCIYDGSWGSVITNPSPQCRLKEKTDIDGFIRDLVVYRPADGERGVYAAVSNKLMQYDIEDDDWTNVKDDCGGPVLDLCVFNDLLQLAMGDVEFLRYWDGSAWTQDAAEKAQCFAVHDNLLWKAEGAILKASKESGVGGWEDYDPAKPTQGAIGDPGTPILAMVSHGGKLFCAKPEGIFEVSYPETFPASQVPPVGNTALDFSTERASRGFISDWLSGLYFPGLHGLFEWKNGILRDAWIERRDAADAVLPGATYEPYSGAFTAAAPTTRGLLLAQSEPGVSLNGHATQVWSHDSRGFHPMMAELGAQGDPCFAVLLDSGSGGSGALWWGVGFEIFKALWPTWTTDFRQSDDSQICRDNTSMVLMPIFSGPDAYELKHWSRVDVHVEQVDLDGTWFDLAASIDGGAPFALSVTSASYNGPTVSFAFPPENASGHSCQLTLTLHPPAQSQYGPRIERLDLFYQPLPETIQQHELTLAVADYALLHTGGQDRRVASEIMADLQALADTDAPFTFTGPWGVSRAVRVMGMVSQLAKQEEKVPGVLGFTLEAIVQMTLLEVE